MSLYFELSDKKLVMWLLILVHSYIIIINLLLFSFFRAVELMKTDMYTVNYQHFLWPKHDFRGIRYFSAFALSPCFIALIGKWVHRHKLLQNQSEMWESHDLHLAGAWWRTGPVVTWSEMIQPSKWAKPAKSCL